MGKKVVKASHQIALPIHLYPISAAVQLGVDVRTRDAVIAVLARLLLEAAVSKRVEEVRDES